MLFALIKNDKVVNVVLADQTWVDVISSEWDHVINIDQMAVPPGIGWSYKLGEFYPELFEPNEEPVKPETWIVTRNAFQNRFPKSSNGVSTKYDLMTLFLTDTGYATSLGVNSDTLYVLRSMLITGSNRLNAVPSVDLKSPDTVSYVNMVTNTMFPEVFRLTQEEADSILKTPAAPNEIPKSTKDTQ